MKEKNRSKIGAKSESNGAKTGEKQGKNRGLRDFAASAKSTLCCKTSSQLRNQVWHTSATSQHSGPHFAAAKAAANHQSMKSSISQGKLHSAGYLAAAKPTLAHECHFAAQEHLFRSCETHCEVVKPDFAPKVPFRRVFRGCEAHFGTRVPFRSTVTLISQLRNGCEVPKREKSQFHSRTPILAIFGHISITSRSSNYAFNISFESLGSHESIASNGARFGFETEKLWPFEDDCANHERKCRTSISLLLNTFLKHFLELKLCIQYLVSKLGKSGVQRFKRYAIWR